MTLIIGSVCPLIIGKPLMIWFKPFGEDGGPPRYTIFDDKWRMRGLTRDGRHYFTKYGTHRRLYKTL